MPTQLMEAIESQDLERARELANENPALISERNEAGLLPATQALYRGHDDLARELLPPDDQLSIFEAASFGRWERVDQLLNEEPRLARQFSPDGFTPLHLAIFSGDVMTVRTVLAHDPDLEAGAQGSTAKGVRPLGTAIFVHRAGFVKLLIDAGADVNGREGNGFTPLHAATENQDEAIVRLLLARGADPSARDEQGRTSEEIARQAGDPELADVLRV
jgi:uncharacterized protein